MAPTTESKIKDGSKANKKRKFLSFGLKTFLLLFCSAAIGVNYWRTSLTQRESLEVLVNCGAEFIYEHEMGDDFDYLADPWVRTANESGVRNWFRSILGSSVVDRVACVRMIEKSNFARIRPDSGDRKYHQTDAWIALRKLNQINALKAVAVEANSNEQQEILSGFFQLRYLQLISYAENDLEALARLPRLETLELATPSNELDWIAKFPEITSLRIRKVLPAPRLTIDVSFLSEMPQLESLEFRAVQLQGVDAIGGLANLNELSLIHTDVESIEPFAGLELEELCVRDSAIRDASAVLKMPSLKKIDLSETLLSKTEVAELRSKLAAANPQAYVIATGSDLEEIK